MAKATDKKIQYSIFDGMLQTISSKKEQLTQEQFDNIKYAIAQALFTIDFDYLPKNERSKKCKSKKPQKS